MRLSLLRLASLPMSWAVLLCSSGILAAQGPAASDVQTAAPKDASSLYPAVPVVFRTHTDALGSTYIPVDSPVYPMALRLYSLGYLDSIFIGSRPWTRRSLLHALSQTTPDVTASNDDEAIEILARLQTILAAEGSPEGKDRGRVEGVETIYTRLMGVGGPVLRDSYHLGQTINNDYGRPYQSGFNNITGFSTINEVGRFSLYVRGEYQHAPSAAGYNAALSRTISNIDAIPYPGTNNYQLHQDTIPSGPIASQNPFRLQEATLSYHLLGHELSFGKSDAWLGPGYGGAMAWSNNAENIYSFRINRVEPMHIPLFSKIFGPVRYDFLVGSLQGHSAPNAPWVHQELISLSPTKDLQISFQRTAIWGGHGHGCLLPDGSIYPCNEPITLHTFLKSFFSISDVTVAEKYSRSDPGARFSSFTFSYRLPFLRRYLTLYTDSTTHDDVFPISAPRRAGWRPGLYLSHVPGMPKLDLRAEAVYTDYVTLRSVFGQANYFEGVQQQGYTNKGFIFGDWIGREAKGGQVWFTYHLSAADLVQVEYLRKKNAKDFIPGGTTQNQLKVEAVKHFSHDLSADAWVQYEHWIAPIYLPGAQDDVTAAIQVTWHPKLRVISRSGR